MNYRPRSLAQKFFLILILSMGSSSVLTTILFTAGTIFEVYHNTQDQLQSLTLIISKNSQADLLFNDANSAKIKLEALQTKSEITKAVIYDANGVLFASYTSPLHQQHEDARQLPFARLLHTSLQATQAITQGADVIGRVIIYADIYATWLRLIKNLFIVTLGIFASMALAITLGMRLSRRAIRPIKELAQVADKVSKDQDYSIRVDNNTQDEIGLLIGSFNLMLIEIQGRDQQLQCHRDSLEDEVKQRTIELSHAKERAEAANQIKDIEIIKRKAVHKEMVTAHKKIEDSIECASLIQKAILPTQQLSDFLGEHHCVKWHPRDVVGGDFYIFHVHQQSYLLGIIDCAGHGVPGALMTMLARAALDQAINKHGISSPAMLLETMDAILRNRLQNAKMSRGLAVNMDAGLAFVDVQQQQLLFAGAKMSLYWTNGQQVEEIKGGNRTILSNKVGYYADVQLPVTSAMTFCITSDGILDQAGGTDGFGFGNTRFTKVFCQHATQPVAEQADIMMNAIHDYRGNYEQRDDITLLFFKPKHKKTGLF